VTGAAPDAVVVGSGPNGMAGALTLATAGLRVEVIEAAPVIGGGCRTEELTLPGFRHDVCSAVHPLAAASPFFRQAGLAAAGLRLLTPPVALAHPLDGGRAVVLAGSVADTAAGLGADAGAYRRLLGPLTADAETILAAFLGPLRSVPARPAAAVRFAAAGLPPAALLARRLRTDGGRALLAGLSAHAIRPLTAPATGGYGLLLAMIAHWAGWPVAEGGSAAITTALATRLAELGGSVRTGRPVRGLTDLPDARVTLLDTGPRQLAALAPGRLPRRYAAALSRFRYGPGVCKVDWALRGPVPWTAPAARWAGTLHLGGTLAEIARSEAEVAAGRHPDRPFCIVAQPGVVDPGRAPAGQHTLYGYCHVPAGSAVDMTARIEAQIERFAPGFGELILARATRTASDLAACNPNYVGGDIGGGLATLRRILLGPVPRWNPYRTPLPGVYLCSSSTPPGAGVHGMCGWWAARTALADLGIR
jgi:phytoene dehydrogenase-like protein